MPPNPPRLDPPPPREEQQSDAAAICVPKSRWDRAHIRTYRLHRVEHIRRRCIGASAWTAGFPCYGRRRHSRDRHRFRLVRTVTKEAAAAVQNGNRYQGASIVRRPRGGTQRLVGGCLARVGGALEVHRKRGRAQRRLVVGERSAVRERRSFVGVVRPQYSMRWGVFENGAIFDRFDFVDTIPYRIDYPDDPTIFARGNESAGAYRATGERGRNTRT